MTTKERKAFEALKRAVQNVDGAAPNICRDEDEDRPIDPYALVQVHMLAKDIHALRTALAKADALKVTHEVCRHES